ncbi:hypothetical protein SMU103_05006 [Streptococcus mutans SA38]|nr:hypothetical protein SMU22_08592 [Streptococcus mutans 4SM1]EMC48614.1 hypothetical protein SMU103_05006 [Streptococcus mutans SA38]EMC60662.1 hypothetical protein SMU109_00165 [Streptococcus mutans OMZ175]
MIFLTTIVKTFTDKHQILSIAMQGHDFTGQYFFGKHAFYGVQIGKLAICKQTAHYCNF